MTYNALQYIPLQYGALKSSVCGNTIQCIAGLKEVAIQLMSYIPVVEGVRRNVVVHGDQGSVIDCSVGVLRVERCVVA